MGFFKYCNRTTLERLCCINRVSDFFYVFVWLYLRWRVYGDVEQ